MSKSNLIKKFVLYAFAIIYDVVSILWCYIISSNFVYNLTEIQMNEHSIGIIGGADKPTLLFLLKYSDGHLLFALILGLTLFLCGGFCLIFKRTVTNNCRLKTTALSLIISFFGASGLSCFFIWYSIVAFLEMSMHPIAYPLSIIGGILSLVAFIIAIILYIKARKEHFKIKGIIIDILRSITTLPILFLLVAKIFAILQSF